MLALEHLDDDSEELADGWHAFPPHLQVCPSIWPEAYSGRTVSVLHHRLIGLYRIRFGFAPSSPSRFRLSASYS
jgi:hypothetical protein